MGVFVRLQGFRCALLFFFFGGGVAMSRLNTAGQVERFPVAFAGYWGSFGAHEGS